LFKELEQKLASLTEDDLNEFAESKRILLEGFYTGPLSPRLSKRNESVQKYSAEEPLTN